jgi:hypothetical protein
VAIESISTFVSKKSNPGCGVIFPGDKLAIHPFAVYKGMNYSRSINQFMTLAFLHEIPVK